MYHLLKAHDLITGPAFVVVKAADAFAEQTTAPNQLWQTDFTYLKVIGWGWFYLSTILDDFSRFIVAWKLCGSMRAGDVTRWSSPWSRNSTSRLRLAASWSMKPIAWSIGRGSAFAYCSGQTKISIGMPTITTRTESGSPSRG